MGSLNYDFELYTHGLYKLVTLFLMERFLNATSRNLPPSSSESEDIPTRKYFESFTDVLMVLVTFSAVIILLPLIFFKLFLQIDCCSTLCSRKPNVESASAGS